MVLRMKYYLNIILSLYAFTFNNIGKITIICLPIIGGALATLASLILVQHIGIFIIAPSIIYTLLYTTKAIYGVHRLYLTGNTNGFHTFAWNQSEFQFFGKAVLFGLIGLALTLIAGLLLMPVMASTLHASPILALPINMLVMLALYLGIALFMLRYVLYFPAKAVDKYLSFSESADLMKGKLIKYSIFLFAATLPLMLLELSSEFIMDFLKSGHFLTFLLSSILTVAFLSISIAIYASSLSFVYKEVISSAPPLDRDSVDQAEEFID